jgi:DNA-binding MarR family transcriptional regulator
MSMDAAVINLASAFEYGQGYVALSRVRTLSGMFLLGLNDRALEVHPTILKRDAVFQELSDAAQTSFEDLGEKQLATLQQNFIIASGGRIEPRTSIQMSAGSGGKGKGSRPYDIDALREKHPNIGAPWDKAQEEILMQLFHAGEKTKDIAEKMGRKSGGIRSRLRLLGLIDDGKTKISKGSSAANYGKVDTKEETRRLLKEERSIFEIAAQRGLTRGTIISHLEELARAGAGDDIAYLKNEISEEKFARIVAAFASLEGTEAEGRLSPVKVLSGDDVSFDEIRLAKLFL